VGASRDFRKRGSGQDGDVIRLESSIVIDRPVDEVFAFTTDPSKLAEWQHGAVEARVEGPMQPGAKIVETRLFLGRRVTSTLEVVDFEPPRRFALRALSGPVRFRFEQTTEAEDGATRVSVVVEGDPGPLFRLATPLLERTLRRELEEDAARLKQILERRG
jgi:uncharacterized protein YndB with AHSA1/START domain